MTFGVGILVLGHDHISHVVKMFYFFLKYSSTLWHISDRLKIMLIITKERSTKIINFITSGAGFLY